MAPDHNRECRSRRRQERDRRLARPAGGLSGFLTWRMLLRLTLAYLNPQWHSAKSQEATSRLDHDAAHDLGSHRDGPAVPANRRAGANRDRPRPDVARGTSAVGPGFGRSARG